MKNFTSKEQIFPLDIMIRNLWLFLDRTSLYLAEPLKIISSLFDQLFELKRYQKKREFMKYFWVNSVTKNFLDGPSITMIRIV